MGRGLKIALGGVAIVGFALTAFAGEPAKKSNTRVETAESTSTNLPAVVSPTEVNPAHDKAVAFVTRCEELRATWYDATLAGEYGKAEHAMKKLEKLIAKDEIELGNTTHKRDKAAAEITDTRSVTNRYRLISQYLDLVKRDFGLPSGAYASHHEK